MTTRRDLLGGAGGVIAGIGFVTCSLINAAQAQHRRRDVVVNGRRVRTVDVHAHCAVPEAMALMGLKVSPEALLVSQDRIRAMDEQGIDIEALSINPYWYKADRDLARQIIKVQNEKLAEICAEQPDRFVAFATVALQLPDLAAEQLEEAVKKLGLRGTLIGGSVNGEELAAPKFHPFWAKAEELGALVFIHPQGTAELSERLKGNGGLGNVIGNPLETTIALSHLIFEGTPVSWAQDLRGAWRRLPAVLRSPLGCGLRDLPCPMRQAPQQKADRIFEAALLRFARLYVRGTAPLECSVGVGQIVLGTDYP